MAQAPFKSRPVVSLIQGVSQQVPQQRKDAQCQAQFDCINHPVLGISARPGADLFNFRSGIQRPGAFTWETRRGTTEHYLMVLYQGTLEIYDLNTGALCTVTDDTGADGYLNPTGGVLDEDNFRAQQIGDYTFIINKNIAPAYTTAKSPAQLNEALVFFQSGNYSMTYEVAIGYNGVDYVFTYTTPDNSVSSNAVYIYTTQLAATFGRAMTAAGSTGVGLIGQVGAGDAGGSPSGGSGQKSVVVAPINLTTLGFVVQVNGNLIRISRTDTNAFTIDVSDGVGGTSISAFKGTVEAFSDLPEGGFGGMLFEVIGGQSQTGGNAGFVPGYWVEFQSGGVPGGASAAGAWVEVPAPNISTTLDPRTMPHQVFCSALDTFAIQQGVWLPRICGDGVNTALDPGFVGKYPVEIGTYQGRLVIMTETTVDWSEALHYYTFYPQTAQEVLASDPISITPAAQSTTSLLRRATMVDESYMLWAQLAQFRVNSGVEAFEPETVQYPESTSYQFNEGSNFCKVGLAVYFAYEPGPYAQVICLQFETGRPAGDTDVTAHVPAYIPGGTRWLSVDQQIKMLFVRTDGAPSNLYLYNFLYDAATIEQSAWNTWRLPTGSVLWQSIFLQYLYVLHQRADGLALLKIPLNLFATDAGQTDRLTRMDMRLTESQVTVGAYNATANTTTLTLPFSLQSGDPKLLAAIRTTSGSFVRGRALTIVSSSGTSAVIRGSLVGAQFYIGFAICSSRQESEFFLRTATGHIPTERLQIKNFVMEVQQTGYSRIEIVQGSGQTKKKEFFPVNLNAAVEVLGASPTLSNGDIRIACDTEASELTVTTINDSFLPSRWVTCEWQFVATERPMPMLSPMGGPVQ